MTKKNIGHIITAISLMASKEGATIERLQTALAMKRRNVFSLINEMEKELRIPVTASREADGTALVYRLPESYTARLSAKTIQVSLTLDEALLVYSLLGNEPVCLQNETVSGAQTLKDKIETALNT
jgi:hypothetical protein